MIYTSLYMEPGMTVPEKFFFDFQNHEDLGKQVDGGFEISEITIGGFHYDILSNDLHKIQQLPPTLALSHERQVYDVLGGRIIILKSDQLGRTISLNDDDIQRIREFFQNNTLRIFIGDLRIPVWDGI